jgi:hypothetical protein
MMRGIALIPLLMLCAGCPLLPIPPGEPEDAELADLDARYEAICGEIAPYGPGGRAVLDVAYRVLREGRAEGRWPLVGLEDLWAEAIKEGAVLFNRPERRWGWPDADKAVYELAQKAIGPWQITIRNIRHVYGRPYGIEPDWPDPQVYEYCRDHPEIQASMAADYIQEAYEKYGRRGPYGIQRYYSLRAFVRGEIGAGAWDSPVVPAGRGGKASPSTRAMKVNTGFYAKQVLLGTRANPHGLIYWLWVTGDHDGIRDVLQTWYDQRLFAWDDARQKPLATDTAGRFAIRPEDLKYLSVRPECRERVEEWVRNLLAEPEDEDQERGP